MSQRSRDTQNRRCAHRSAARVRTRHARPPSENCTVSKIGRRAASPRITFS
jgi:hypothetical protein